MAAQQSESNRIVVERGGSPARSGVALGTYRAQLSGVDIVFVVARGAICGRPFELVRGVTVFACDGHMLTIQLEDGCIVVKGRRLPSIRDMAAPAIGSELTGVNIVFGMAGGTIHRRSPEPVTEMATGAVNRGMFSF